MKFDKIKSKVENLIKDRYFCDHNVEFIEELISLSADNLKNKDILRIKRLNVKTNNWKTLLFIEIVSHDEDEIKAELKSALSWVAIVKERLLGSENTDLYLFLAFNRDISVEECLRIESTEQFCRKYVLLPKEDILDFIDRTFLQKFKSSKGTAKSADPIVKAFSNTLAEFSWLTPEIQTKWYKAFSELSGSELLEGLLEGEGKS
ncbi:ABC-three component system middle component 1 [Paenibacillus sp. FSL H3-0469]|uniref:ABC-three component system middle component 1 n=1 Tax=Paenibacillus sp. FSL H3-0469 TaxID=2954506 RepID=UPI003101A8E0